MKYRKRGFFQRVIYAVGLIFSIGAIAILTLTGIFIDVKAEKEGTTFRQAAVAFFVGNPPTKTETYTGERPALPNLEKISEKQRAESQPAPPRELTQSNGKATAHPVAYSVPPAKASHSDEYGVCPTCKHFHDLNKSCAEDAAFVKSTVVKKAQKTQDSRKYSKKAATKAATPTPQSPPVGVLLESLKSNGSRPFEKEKDAPNARQAVTNVYPKKTRYWFPF